MTEPAEFWAFLAVNSILFLAGTVLTGLSYRAYLRVRQEAIRFAAGGFALITLGGLLELFYEVGIKQGYNLSGREMLLLQSVESLFISLGLLVIFYALTRY